MAKRVDTRTGRVRKVTCLCARCEGAKVSVTTKLDHYKTAVIGADVRARDERTDAQREVLTE